MRADFLPFAQPDLDEAELVAIKDALTSGWITTGPKTHEFESQFADYVGAEYALAVNSCTAAMHLALEAVGLQAGDEVITTPYTFASTAEVVRYFDATPVLVDVRPDDFNLDPNLAEAAITEQAKAVVPVHIAGLSADLASIYALARQHDLAVIEDAAHALPARYNGHMVGAPLTNHVTAATCFSFYATKTLTTGEGGMITTNDEVLAERCRVMALHGISKDAWKRYTAEGSWYYEIVAPGFKYNMTDIAAALGLAQLGKAEQMWQRRREIAQCYNAAFGPIRELETPVDPDDRQHAWHLYMLRLNLDQLRIDRAQFVAELKQRNIGTSVHFIPLHLHPYYRETYGYEPTDFPVAYREYQREISLPIYSKMTDRDVDDVINAVHDVTQQTRLRRRRVRSRAHTLVDPC